MYENQAVQYVHYTQYDGTNAAAIFDAASDGQPGTWSYNEDNNVLTIKQDFGDDIFDEWSAPENGYFLWRPDGTMSSGMTEAEFDSMFVKLGDMVNDEVTAASGIEAVGTLGINASTTVTVTLNAAFADTNFSVAPIVFGGLTVLGKLEVTAVSIVDESHVNVTVHNTGLVSLSGASVLVQAVK